MGSSNFWWPPALLGLQPQTSGLGRHVGFFPVCVSAPQGLNLPLLTVKTPTVGPALTHCAHCLARPNRRLLFLGEIPHWGTSQWRGTRFSRVHSPAPPSAPPGPGCGSLVIWQRRASGGGSLCQAHGKGEGKQGEESRGA